MTKLMHPLVNPDANYNSLLALISYPVRSTFEQKLGAGQRTPKQQDTPGPGRGQF